MTTIPNTFNLSKIGDDVFNISNNSGKSKLQVTLTGENSNFVNELGVFTVNDAQGKINGIVPGAAGYTQAALDRSKVILSAIAFIFKCAYYLKRYNICYIRQ